METRLAASFDPARIDDDLRLEGPPEKEFNPGIANRLPRKNVAAGALIRDEQNKILFVVPTYKPFLEIPGGLAEDNESPKAACEREISEELGLKLTIGSLLIIDWTPTHGPWRDSLQLIYDGGRLTPSQIAAITLDATELGSLRFLTLDDSREQLRPSMARRMSLALAAVDDGQTIYAEFGHRL